MADTKIPITIFSTKRSDPWEGWVEPNCHARALLEGLESPEIGYLDKAPAGQPYSMVLRRTATEFTPDMTMAAAGVRTGDVLEVRPGIQGARGSQRDS